MNKDQGGSENEQRSRRKWKGTKIKEEVKGNKDQGGGVKRNENKGGD